LVLNNSAATYGGGIRCFNEAVPTIINNLVVGNQAAISGGGIECDSGAQVDIRNTILWDNDAPAGTEMWVGPRTGSHPVATISYSDVEGGMASVYVYPGSTLNWGSGMIQADPLFRDPEADDYHLMATACGDTLDSPCIDTGDPAVTDNLLDCSHGLGATRSDIGAYGGQGEGPPLTVETDDVPLSRSVQLFQNFPNPFNPSTTIRFDLFGSAGEQSKVSVVVYDLRGSRVKTLVNSELGRGLHTLIWGGQDEMGRQVSSGVYLYSLTAGRHTVVRRMVLLK
jgi:hypothetical protein